MICLHHNDLDGRAAAAIVYQANKHCTFIEMDYRMPLPYEKILFNEEVYIVDFSLQRPGDWERLIARTGNVVWIDHHETAINKRPDLDMVLSGTRRTDRCGAWLTWKWFNRDTEPPYVIQLVDMWDRWKHNDDPDVLNFVAGMKIEDQGPTAEIWEVLLDDYGVDAIQQNGKIIREYERLDNQENLEAFGHTVVFEGYSCLVLNSIRRSSLVFGGKLSDYDICIAYVHDGKNFTVSLYSTTIKVNDIAVKYGGGGHSGAAGFVCNQLPWSNPDA